MIYKKHVDVKMYGMRKQKPKQRESVSLFVTGLLILTQSSISRKKGNIDLLFLVLTVNLLLFDLLETKVRD